MSSAAPAATTRMAREKVSLTPMTPIIKRSQLPYTKDYETESFCAGHRPACPCRGTRLGFERGKTASAVCNTFGGQRPTRDREAGRRATQPARRLPGGHLCRRFRAAEIYGAWPEQ